MASELGSRLERCSVPKLTWHVAESVMLRMGDTFSVSLTEPNNAFYRRIISCSGVSGTRIAAYALRRAVDLFLLLIATCVQLYRF